MIQAKPQLLRDCRFLVSSYQLRFAAYSDQLCRVVHLKTVRFDTPGSSERVDWYTVEPSGAARWVAVQETVEFDKTKTRFFIHDGENFLERPRSQVSTSLLVEINRRIFPPRLKRGMKASIESKL